MFRLIFTYLLPLLLPVLGYLAWNWLQLRRTQAGEQAEPTPDPADMPWIILAGVSIAIYQVRRCNDVIQTLRQAYTVQFQIEKAEAQREAEELEKAKRELR